MRLTQSSSIRALVSTAIASLGAAGVENPRLDAEALLAAASGASRAAIVSGLAEIDTAAVDRFDAMLVRRAQREPLSYIVGHKEFYSLEFETTSAVLIPRPETETLVAAALKLLRVRPDAALLDIGTGSGAIALAVAANAPLARITASDVSPDALAVAGRNAARLGLTERVEFRLCDLFEPADGDPPLGRFDLIVSNPPYIEDDQLATLPPEISRYEPRLALAGGGDGLDFYRGIMSGIVEHLNEAATVIFEIGSKQSEVVAEIVREAGASDVVILEDLAGLQRVVHSTFSQNKLNHRTG
jgi:release factor glutamine methyltransferase